MQYKIFRNDGNVTTVDADSFVIKDGVYIFEASGSAIYSAPLSEISEVRVESKLNESFEGFGSLNS